MEQQKTKFLEQIKASFETIIVLEKEINEGYKSINPEDKYDKLGLGGKMLQLNQANTELFKSIDLYLTIMEGTIEDLDDRVKEYYLQIEELKKPISETDPEDIKKLKEYIKSVG